LLRLVTLLFNFRSTRSAICRQAWQCNFDWFAAGSEA